MYRLLLSLALLLPTAHSTDDQLPSYQARFERQRPLIAVVGDNRMTELVDYVVPYAVLKQADVGDVYALSLDEGPLQMMPALRLQAEQTIASFDRQYPQGADYLIVPAVHRSDDARLGQWVAEQARKGATVVGVCDGVLVLGYAGLLDGKRATGHWYSQRQREDDFPTTHWQRDIRYISDGKLITTAGVTAALPVSLALVQAIAGPLKAGEIARQLGVSDWSPHHDSSAFGLTTGDYATAAGNLLAFWGHETLRIDATQGMDDITLALRADAWSRTFRSEVIAVANHTVVTRNGLHLLPDAATSQAPALPPTNSTSSPIAQLEQTLGTIAARYDAGTARLVRQQLEYPEALNH